MRRAESGHPLLPAQYVGFVLFSRLDASSHHAKR